MVLLEAVVTVDDEPDNEEDERDDRGAVLTAATAAAAAAAAAAVDGDDKQTEVGTVAEPLGLGRPSTWDPRDESTLMCAELSACALRARAAE